MINIIIWLGLFLCPNPNHTPQNHGDCPYSHGTVVTTNNEPGGGETGGTPKPPVPPPPPPPQP